MTENNFSIIVLGNLLNHQKTMHSQSFRSKYLNYFKNKGHTIVPSSPVIPHNDPTLLFINAGMNQFKDVFLGKSLRDYKRATSSQKCVRVGGKHNDLENVGHTSRHLTFFEMLGNFSFGDYFKKEAIAFAWEVACNVFNFDPQKVWATVLHNDEESFALWQHHLPADRIVRMSEKDNFWAMGDTGPCGPCSELLYDRGPSYGPARNPAEDVTGERYLEFWNLVFMQFNRDSFGNLELLPKPCVDTGAGLERVVSLTMNVDSLFETDILRSLISKVEAVSGHNYDPHHKTAPAFRVIADHLRSLAFAIADGVQPSNIDRGYVLRKILRRAVRYGRTLGLEKPFLATIFPRLIETMGEDYPELKIAQERIKEILTLEEESFLRTLKRGGNILNQIIAESEKKGHQISGEDAFKLKDTYGLPLEEILLLAKDANLSVNIEKFEELEKEAKERSRQTRKQVQQTVSDNIYASFLENHGPTQFLGYHQLSCESLVLGIVKDNTFVTSLSEGEEGMVILNQTPFYAEKGGQVGDQGLLSSQEGTLTVLDCQSPFTDVIAHRGIVDKGSISVGDKVTATVDAKTRQKIANNHTATHLLHWALVNVLGEHVKQAGSVVDASRLRFDFNHHKALSPQEIKAIELLVNQKIRENTPVTIYEVPFEEASKHKEIKQFFGDKYGNLVRVVDIDYSKELCGGTHTHAVGSIGLFKISKESSIAAGVRRIEALTGEQAEALIYENEKLIDEVSQLVKVQKGQLLEKVGKLVEDNQQLTQEIQALRKEILSVEVDALATSLQHIGKIPFLGKEVQLSSKELKDCADLLMKKIPSLVLLLANQEEGKCSLLARVSPDLVSRGLSASTLIKEIASSIEGKGGGKADSAQAGGTRLEGIEEAIHKARSWVEKQC